MGMTTITSNTGRTYQTMSRGFQQFHVWSRVWPSPARRYEGVVWAADATEAGTPARRQFGNGKVYDIQTAKNGGIVRKGA